MGADPARCSFCAKTQDEVYILIAGPAAFICDECVDLSNDLLIARGPVRWRFVAAWRSWRRSLHATLSALTLWVNPITRIEPPGADSRS